MSISEFDRSSFEVLKKFFAGNPKFKEIYDRASAFERVTLWSEYQSTLEKSSAFPIEGIQNKLKDARSMDKLHSTLAELRVAVALAEAGHSILQLQDKGTPEWGVSPPDLTLTCKEFEAAVEVTRCAPDNTSSDLYELFTPIMEANNLVLSYFFPAKLSEPVINFDERNKRRIDLIKVVDGITECIKSLDRSRLPFETIIHGVRIELKAAESYGGYAETPGTSAYIVPETEYEQQLLHRLKKKAGKPEKWMSARKKRPYFIAFEVEQPIGQYNVICRILYGCSTFVSDMGPGDKRAPAVEYPEIVKERLSSSSWRDLLLALGYDSTHRRYISEIGFFLKEPRASNVCGVLTLHRSCLEFFPNPFAESALLRADYHQLLHIPIASVITKHDHRIE